MPIQQFVVDKGGAGNDAYAAAPDIDLSDAGGGNHAFVPDYYLCRSDANNAAEVIVSWDGKTDGIQLPLVANNGGFYIHIPSHARKVWVKRATAGVAAAKALISACTNS